MTSLKENSEANRDQKFSSISKVLEGKNDQFLQQLREIHKNSCILWQNASEFDFDPSIPANGIRSIIQMINMMFNEIDYAVHHLQVKRNQQMLREWEVISGVFFKLTQMELQILKRNEDFRDKQIPNDSSVYTDIDKQLLLTSFAIGHEEIRPLHSLLGFFWLKKGYDKEYKRMIILASLAKCGSSSLVMKLLFNNDLLISHMSKMNQSCSISGIRKGLDVFLRFPFKTIANMKWNAKGTTKQIVIPKQQEWKLLVRDSQSLTELVQSAGEACEALAADEKVAGQSSASQKEEDMPETSEYLTGLVIGRENCSHSSDTVILHMHGGAFVACTPHHHANYLKVWSKSLNLPVICPNYVKAPEHPFPDALQDALDSYLFLISGDERVKNILGFHPKNIILSGDSAGGWLALAVTFVLCDLLTKDSRVRMPSGILVQYPAVNLSYGLDPSHGIAILNPLLTASLNALCLASLAKKDTKIESESWSADPDVWTKIPPLMETRIKDPYFNLLSFKKWEDLGQIPLFVTVCEYDSLLDGGISLCKLWKGPVKLDVARGTDHGFLFMPSEHTRVDFDRVIDRFRECLTLISNQIQ